MTPGACLGPEMQNLAVNLFPVPVDAQPKCSRVAAFRDHCRGGQAVESVTDKGLM